MPFIKIDDHSLVFYLRRSPKVRRLQLMAKPDHFEIVAPMRTSNLEALRFLWQHRQWMVKQHRRKKGKVIPKDFLWPQNFLAHEGVPFRGDQLLLQIKFGFKAQLVQQSSVLVVTLPWHKTHYGELEQAVKQSVVAWYQQQAIQIIQQTLDYYCPLLGRWPTGFALKRQKTRWGSCGASGKININWLLVLGPPGVLEYVVVHELCHLFHRNHGVRFWAKVAQYLPDYERFDKWLNKQGHCLRPV